MTELPEIYRNYISCLNSRKLELLDQFVDENVTHNNREMGIEGYRMMLKQNFSDIPDLWFDIQLLIHASNYIACRLSFYCKPIKLFLGLPINGQQVQFTENVFYYFENNKIKEVWSVVDKAAIEAQLNNQ